jgi:hypothetical protein
VIHVPAHEDHFFDVHRYEFDTEVEIQTLDRYSLLTIIDYFSLPDLNFSVQVLSVVEGVAVEISVAGKSAIFNYAESFVVPAAAHRFKLKNMGKERVKVLVVFLKKEWTMASLMECKPGTQLRKGLFLLLPMFVAFLDDTI